MIPAAKHAFLYKTETLLISANVIKGFQIMGLQIVGVNIINKSFVFKLTLLYKNFFIHLKR
jgi:hypothetical protein